MQLRDDTTLPSRGQASRVNAPKDGFGSKSVSRRCRLDVRFARKRTRSAPALGERRHRGLARRGIVALSRLAVVVWPKPSVHTMARQPARELLDQINPPGEPNDSLDDI